VQIIAFLLAVMAIFCFLFAAYLAPRTAPPPNRAWHFGWLGLAFLTGSWMVELIVQTGGHVSIN
jgi:hypothetical protein